ncbi:MAG: bifunctional 4-hydroxy-2-oxoglutarate aldolase/2-dehydro-3-deoxy-phosphogluconate aldolase [Chroococcales cyanobacterium]
MTKNFWLSQLESYRAIAVIRSSNIATGKFLAKAVAKGGMRLIEITWNSENPSQLISQLRSELPNCTIGTGTILTLEDFNEAITAGAQFCFTPHVNLPLIEAAVNANIPIIPGALTPTEIITAWQAGASCVKVFPAQAVGGAKYIQSLQGPMGSIPLIPTGGVTIENANTFLQAGAIAVGLSGDLFPHSLVVKEDWNAIAKRAKFLHEEVSMTPRV